MSFSQSATSQWGWGFHTLGGGIDPKDLRLRISSPEMENYPPRGVLALCAIPSQSAIGQWGWGFHIVQGGFDRGITVFVPRLSQL